MCGVNISLSLSSCVCVCIEQGNIFRAPVLRGLSAYTHLEASKSLLCQHGVYSPGSPRTKGTKIAFADGCFATTY